MGLSIKDSASLDFHFLIWQRGILWGGHGVAAQSPARLWASVRVGCAKGLRAEEGEGELGSRKPQGWRAYRGLDSLRSELPRLV